MESGKLSICFKILLSLHYRKLFLFFSFILFTFSPDVQAKDPGSARGAYALGEIVVTATRAEVSKQDVAANIAVITREDIEKIPASNVAEVLQYIPGMYVEFGAGLGGDTTAFIQGSYSQHVAVFQDGVPLNQLLNPRTNLTYIPIDTIDRIEVYKGAASSAWGSGLGGVINIITKEPDKKRPFSADVQTSYGERRTSKNRGTLSGTRGRLGYLISLVHDESDGFIEHTEYKQDAIYAKLNYELGASSRLNFAYSYDEGHSEDPIISDPDFWDDLSQRRMYQRLLFEASPVDNLVLTLEGRHHQFDSQVDDVYSNYKEIYNDYEEEIWGVSACMNYTSGGANTFNLGFDEDWGKFHWISDVWEDADIDGDVRNWAVYANDTTTLGDFSFNAGLRYDHNSNFGGEFSPSGGIVYRIAGNDALVRAQVAKGFSAPDASWIHSNPDLGPEVAINYQLGAEVQPVKFLRVELNLFQANIKDLINLFYNDNSKRWEWENIDEVTRRGVEGSISAIFDFGLALSFGGSYVTVRDEKTDDVIMDIPRKTLNISATYTYQWMTHAIHGKHIDHNSTYPETHDEVFVFDYILRVKLPFTKQYVKPSLFCAVYNLTDANYLYRSDWPQPGRWVEGGIRFEF